MNDMNTEITGYLAQEGEFATKSNAVVDEVNTMKENDQVEYSRDMTAMREDIEKRWKENEAVSELVR